MDRKEDIYIAGTAFETYVLSILKDYLSATGKGLPLVGDYDTFDALLPDGIDDIPGPLYLETKAIDSGKSAYFRSVERFASHMEYAEPGAILLVLGTSFKSESKQNMVKLAEGCSKKKVYIWDVDDFKSRTQKYSEKYEEYLHSPAKALVNEAINNPQSRQDSINTKNTLVGILKRKYQKEELALFVGAGISKDAGIPQWNELINILLSKMISSHLKDNGKELLQKSIDAIVSCAHKYQENSPIAQMRYIKASFDAQEYNNLVHDALYSKKHRIDTTLLKAIAEICTPRRNHIGVQGIVTYNFDDLLERCLKRKNVPSNTIYGEDGISVPDKLSVFHVHGYLPKNRDDNIGNMELIFSEEDYHRVYRDAYCWSNLVQLNYLRERTCLFIGCSLTDPNLRRLLDVAKRNNEKPRHFAFLKRNTIIPDEQLDSKALSIYEDIDFGLRERYYATLGLNIIWVDSFEEIPQILNSLLD